MALVQSSNIRNTRLLHSLVRCRLALRSEYETVYWNTRSLVLVLTTVGTHRRRLRRTVYAGSLASPSIQGNRQRALFCLTNLYTVSIYFRKITAFDVFFDLRLNKRLNKQSWGWWFERLSRPFWRHCNVKLCSIIQIFQNGRQFELATNFFIGSYTGSWIYQKYSH